MLPGLEELRFEALGTSCHLLGLGLQAGSLATAEAWVRDMHRRFSRFLDSSELSCFNAAAGSWVALSPELEALLQQALQAYVESGGLVHCGVLPSMLATGYTRPLAEGPTAARLAAPAPLPPLPEILELEPGRARLRAGSGIDLGGIAKGWMADSLAETLAPDCLVNLGGDLFARGEGPAGEGWPVALGGVTVLLCDQGAASSGTGRRRWTHEGRTLHHLIDPRTGRPAESDLEEVSVVASSASRAEVAAKTALLLGAERATGYLATHTVGWWLK